MEKLVLLPAAIHIYIFVLESLLWGKKRTNKVFGINELDANATRLMAFNQGFYNLFLAIALVLGLYLREMNISPVMGEAFILYGLGSMMAAGLVLLISSPKLWRASMIQILPALLALYPFERGFIL